MARPRGRTKTARVTVNLDDQAFVTLQAVAEREGILVGQVARRAVMAFLAAQKPSLNQPTLPLIRSTTARPEGPV